MKVPVLVLHAAGTNRDRDAAWACELAGGAPEIVHVSALTEGRRRLDEFRMLVIPGGFSFGDDLGAGRVWAVILRARLGDDLRRFVDDGRPVLGVCNGFQVLVKAGLLPGTGPPAPAGADRQVATLTHNASGHFECRWVDLVADPASPCVFTRGVTAPIVCPVAHGEGRLVAADDVLDDLERRHLVALRYAPTPDADGGYPGNPNGSARHIAGLTNPRGNILGLMPHPENHLIPEHHPRYHRGERALGGLPLFRNGVRHAAEL